MKNITIAQQFGTSLDNDDFEKTKSLLAPNCYYHIGEETLIGPDAICNSYEQNMLEGRKKLDELEWGKSRIEAINEKQFIVHFTDYLTHNGLKYTHRCQQQLTINNESKITEIKHIDDPIESKNIKAYYQKVGLNDG